MADMRVRAALRGDLRQVVAAQLSATEKGVTRGVRDVTEQAKTRLRNQVTGAGLGRRLALAWRSQVFPKSGVSLGAAGFVFTRAPKLIRAFSRNQVIRSKEGFYLAIPTDAAPKRGVRGGRINPSNFPEDRFGPLRFVYRKSGPSLLVVDGVRVSQKTGRVSRRAKTSTTKSGAFRSGISTVVMFILVPQITLRKRLDPEREFKRAERALLPAVSRAIDAEQGRAQAASGRPTK